MSLFRPYQYKAKPDIQRDAPTKKGFFLFLELYFRKFWKFLSINLIYFFITFPMLVYVFYLINGIFAERLAAIGADTVLFAGLGFLASMFSFIPTSLYTPLLVISVLLYGPFTMGMTYMFRNYAREEHAWMSDLFARAWSNLKQGLVFGILDILLVWLFVSGMFGNIAEIGKNVSYAMSVILSVVCGIALVIWIIMRHYTYLMAVTVNLGVLRILKNAWLFVVLGFGRNLLSLLVELAMLVLSLMLAPLLTVILLPLFTYSITWFATVFTCYPIVKKYLIVPALEAQEQAVAAEAEELRGELPETAEEAVSADAAPEGEDA